MTFSAGGVVSEPRSLGRHLMVDTLSDLFVDDVASIVRGLAAVDFLSDFLGDGASWDELARTDPG